MPKQGKTPKKKSKEKTPQKSGESEYPAMEQEELKRLVQNAIEQSQAQLQQKHEEQIKRLEADREALEERLTRKFEDEVRELNRAFDESSPLVCFGAGARGPGSPGVGARCGNGLFSTYKSPKFLS